MTAAPYPTSGGSPHRRAIDYARHFGGAHHCLHSRRPTANASTVARHHGGTETGLCQELAHATPGSPAAFRLAEETATQRACWGT
jgi:hypothetical protein